MARKDPFSIFRFIVEINGVTAGGFSEATGFESKTETDDYREGGVNDYVHKIVKETKYSNLVLKRGLTDSLLLYAWYQSIVRGFVVRSTISVVLLDRLGEEKVRWTFFEALPVRWNSSDLSAAGNTIAVETVEFAHQGMVRT
jgi:phage tail-like protein